MKTFKDFALLESGLARIASHLAHGSIGIISAATGADHKADTAAHQNLVRRVREHGYGAIQATGRSKWGPERSLIVPGITKEHLSSLGNEFHQQAVIHVAQGKSPQLHYLNAAGDKAGKSEEMGASHFNKPNDMGVTILKGIGFNPKDTRQPSKSFTFGEDGILESLEIPPFGQLHPLPTPYG